MEEKIVWLAVILGLGTLGFRVVPLQMMSQRKLPSWVARWLTCIPVAVLSALVLPELFIQKGKVDFSVENLYLWVSIPIFFVALKTRNIGVSVLVGMGAVAAIRLF